MLLEREFKRCRAVCRVTDSLLALQPPPLGGASGASRVASRSRSVPSSSLIFQPGLDATTTHPRVSVSNGFVHESLSEL